MLAIRDLVAHGAALALAGAWPVGSDEPVVALADLLRNDPHGARRLHDLIAEAVLASSDRALVAVLPGLWRYADRPAGADLKSGRARKLIERLGAATWAQLCEYSPADLLGLRNVGDGTVFEVVSAAIKVAVFDLASDLVAEAAPDEGPSTVDDADELVVEPEAESETDLGAQHGHALVHVIRTHAAWANARGRKSVEQLLTPDPAALVSSRHLAGLWAEIADVPLAELADPTLLDADLAMLLSELTTDLPESQQIVFERRTLAASPSTLAEVGVSMSISRERVRQLQERVERLVRSRLDGSRFWPLRWLAEDIARELGTHVPVDHPATAEIWQRALSGVPTAEREHARQLLLWLAGPYRLHEAWLAQVDAGVLDPRDLAARADGNGVLTVEEAHDWLAEHRVSDAFRDEWLDTRGRVRRVGDRLAVWSGSVVDKCVALLALHGRPATAEWLVEQVGEGHNVRGVRSRFFDDTRLVRINRSEWALPGWGHEEYSGIAEEIVERIERAGGQVALTDLVEDISRQFGVRAGSVRIYAEAPMFVIVDGNVRLRRDDEPYEVTATVAATRGLFQPEPGRMTLLVLVDRELLRGSGRSCPQALAVALGVQPGDRRSLTSPAGPVTVSWPVSAAFGPSLGSLRDLALSVAVNKGDWFRLDIYLITGYVTATRLSADVNTAPLRRLEDLTGLTSLSDDDAVARVAEAIGVATGDVRRQLLDRGDTAVADSLPRREVGAGLAAALAELEQVLGATT